MQTGLPLKAGLYDAETDDKWTVRAGRI